MPIALLARARLAHLAAANVPSVSTRHTRGIGWLIGPPPKPGSKEAKIKSFRLNLIGVVFLGIVWVCMKTSLYDEKGEFRPTFGVTDIEVRMERASHEALKKQREQAVQSQPVKDQ